ncbi:MAG: hypothetical protein GMKNLPBB_01379 [Myxococcota bacterium]|nr:hypothetical protein [Myxococcota bacterium]
MNSRWNDADASEFIHRYASAGEDLALRVYSSRLIGQDSSLVLHGGGNTSVKTVFRNLLGDEVPALYVKGSGSSLDKVEPRDLPGVDLRYLQRLRGLSSLTDEEMVNQLRTHLFDAAAPNPSIEALLHAFLPPKFVDHSHADAILCLTNRPEGERWVREAMGDEVAIVSYIKPGFLLSKAAAETYDKHPGSIGMVLLKHGLFSYGGSARESYERHIELVSRAERFIGKMGRTSIVIDHERSPVDEKHALGVAAHMAPALRGAIARTDDSHGRWILRFRTSGAIRQFAAAENLAALAMSGPLTPDHIIRTKELPLILYPDDHLDAAHVAEKCESALRDYAEAYRRYFDEGVLHTGGSWKRLDPIPRVLLVRGAGFFTAGRTLKECEIAADIYERTIGVKSVAGGLGAYEALPPRELFEMEYWSLEQAKLGKTALPPLTGKIALVAGAGGPIGAAACKALAEAGAHVAAFDVNEQALKAALDHCAKFGRQVQGAAGDVTSPESAAEMFRRASAWFGGVDIVFLNAGVAFSGPLEQLSAKDWNRIVQVNLDGAFHIMREAARIFRTQGTGGDIILNASKNVFAPGAEFGAYSASKAGAHQLAKVAAIELASMDVRVNMINADAVFSHEGIQSGLWKEVGLARASAHQVDPARLEEFYRQRNLLKTRVTADDVARAVLFFATRQTPTTGATLPVDGGVAAAFPR